VRPKLAIEARGTDDTPIITDLQKKEGGREKLQAATAFSKEPTRKGEITRIEMDLPLHGKKKS